MTQRVKVLRVADDGTAHVIHVRQSACSGDCHHCSGCGAAQETMILTAENPIGAREGDLVLLSSETAPVLKAAAVMYMVPLLLFFLGYLAGTLLWHQGAALGCLAFALGIAGSILYDRKVVKKQKTVYTISGFARVDTQEF